MKTIAELIVRVMGDFDRYMDSPELSKEQVLEMLRSDVVDTIRELE